MGKQSGETAESVLEKKKEATVGKADPKPGRVIKKHVLACY